MSDSTEYRNALDLSTKLGEYQLKSVLGVGGPAPTTPVDRIAAAPLAAPDNSIVFQSFVGGLSSPVLVTHAGDGSGRLFVPELGGRIRIIKNGALLATPFLDITTGEFYTAEGNIEYMDKLKKFGIRNSSLLSQQPNGNGSIFANIVSSCSSNSSYKAFTD